MSEFGKKDSPSPVRRRTGINPVSAMKMPERLTAAVDEWAEAHCLPRSDAICKVDRTGPEVRASCSCAARTLASDAKLEEIAVHEIESLLDPALPADDRERRIRRLTKGL